MWRFIPLPQYAMNRLSEVEWCSWNMSLLWKQHGETPLHIAAGIQTHGDHVKFLVEECSADICATDKVRSKRIFCYGIAQRYPSYSFPFRKVKPLSIKHVDAKSQQI